mmetsp:Transcript_35350/g.112545  ORF Transcript_35350/g.112545 Transcript_35350/m.112545 type:complete len:214 (+) Transcript_35350:353-994(+)
MTCSSPCLRHSSNGTHRRVLTHSMASASASPRAAPYCRGVSGGGRRPGPPVGPRGVSAARGGGGTIRQAPSSPAGSHGRTISPRTPGPPPVSSRWRVPAAPAAEAGIPPGGSWVRVRGGGLMRKTHSSGVDAKRARRCCCCEGGCEDGCKDGCEGSEVGVAWRAAGGRGAANSLAVRGRNTPPPHAASVAGGVSGVGGRVPGKGEVSSREGPK